MTHAPAPEHFDPPPGDELEEIVERIELLERMAAEIAEAESFAYEHAKARGWSVPGLRHAVVVRRPFAAKNRPRLSARPLYDAVTGDRRK